MKTTAERIRALLTARGVSERSINGELAKLCKISPQAVGQWFSTTRRISPEYLAKIALQYRTTMEWLVIGKGSMDDQAANISANITIDELFAQLFTRQGEFTAEHLAALQLIIENFERSATARFQNTTQYTDQ